MVQNGLTISKMVFQMVFIMELHHDDAKKLSTCSFFIFSRWPSRLLEANRANFAKRDGSIFSIIDEKSSRRIAQKRYISSMIHSQKWHVFRPGAALWSTNA